MEPRFLLNGELASLLGSGAFGDMAFDAADGFLAFGSKLEDIITDLDDNFAGLPGMLTQRFEVDGDGNITGEETRPPKIADVLSQQVERDPSTINPDDPNDQGSLYAHEQDFSGDEYQTLAKRADYLFGQANGFNWVGPDQDAVLSTLDLDGDGQASWREAFDVLFVGTMLSTLDDFAKVVDAGGADIEDETLATQDDLDERIGAIAAPQSSNTDGFGNPVFSGSGKFNDLLSLGSGGFTFAANDNASPDFYTLGFSGQLDFGFDHTFDLDFGIVADQLGIGAPTEVYLGGGTTPTDITKPPASFSFTQPTIDLAATLDIPLAFSFALPEVGYTVGDQPDDDLSQVEYDAYVDGFGLRAGTFVGDGSQAIQLEVSSNQPLDGLLVNAGFLGLQALDTDTTDTDSTFTLTIDQGIEITPASLPSTLGFEPTAPSDNTKYASSGGVLTAANPLPAELFHPVEFELAFQLDAWQTANDGPSTPVTVVIDPPEGGETLQDAVGAALVDSGLDDLLTVTVEDIGGEDLLQFALKESSNIAQLDLTPASTNRIEMTLEDSWFSGGDFSAAFLLGVGTNATQLHRVSATGSDRETFLTALETSLDSLPGNFTVTEVLDDGDYTGQVTITLSSGQLYLVDEFTLDADGVVRLEELTTTSANDLFTLPPANDASFAFDLAFEVIEGIERTTGSWGSIEIAFGSADADDDGFINIFDLTGASLTADINGFQRLDYSAEMDTDHRSLLETGLTQEVGDFNQVGANSVIGMLGQLRAWADRVADSTYLSNLDVPFADLVLGEVLGFDALVQETLLLDEIGEAAEDFDPENNNDLAEISRLIAKAKIGDNVETLVPFTNVQELAARLGHPDLGLLDTTTFTDGSLSFAEGGEAVIWYDPVNADAHDPDNPKLLLPLTLSRLDSRVSLAESPVDFLQRAPEDEGGATSLLGPLALDFSSSTAELSVSESMNITLGILLGEGGNLDSKPPLAELGVTPLGDEVLAVTGGGEVQAVYGRLSADASFNIRVTTDGVDSGWQSITITQAATSTNTTVQDLAEDINAQLDGNLSGISAEVLHGRIVLVADSSVDAFDLSVSQTDTAYKEIGLASSRASNVSLSLTTEAAYELAEGSTGTITITPNGVGADNIVLSVPAGITDGNRTLSDLVADLNAQLAADIGVIFSRSGNELILGSIAEGVHYLEVTFSGEFAGLFGKVTGITTAEVGLLLQASGEVADRYGTIASDANISIDFGAGTVDLTVLAGETQAAADEAGVRSIGDLAELLNNKLDGEGVTAIEFVALGAERLGIRALDDSVTQILVTNTDGGAEPLGFADSDDIDASLHLAAAESVAYYFGPDAEASFDIDYNNDGSAKTATITLDPTETIKARSLYDLQRVLQDKVDAKISTTDTNGDFVRLIEVGIDNGRLTFTAADASIASFSVETAADALGLSQIGSLDNLTANSADLLVRTSDGSVFTVDLTDADDDIDAAIAAIQAAADTALGAGKLTIDKAPDNASLLVTDLTGGSGSFAIETLNGSKVARQLGIFSQSGEARQADVADNVIRGDRIGVPTLSDRLSIEHDGRDLLEAELTLTLPNFDAEARLGFIGVGLTADSPEITANFSMGLVDPGPNASGYTLRELFDAVRSSEGGLAVDALRLGQFLELPDITIDAGDIEFKASVLLGDDDPFEDYLDNLGLLDDLGNVIEETFVVRLGDFGNPIDTDFLETLRQLAIDEGIAISNLEGLKTLFEDYLADRGIDLTDDENAFDVVGNMLGLSELPDIAIGDGTDFDFDSFEEAFEAILGDLGSFSALDFSDFGAALESLIDIVQGFSEVDFLSEEIPLLGVSILDMVGIADDFASGIEEILDNPVATLQELEARLGEALGLPEGFIGLEILKPDPINNIDGIDIDDDGVADDLLILEFDFSRAFSEPLNIQLDLADLANEAGVTLPAEVTNNFGLYGAAGLAVSGAIDAKLSFGIDLASLVDEADGSVQEPQVDLLYGDGRTNLSGSLSATGDNLTFNAALGPLGASVRDGTALVDLAFDLFDTASGSLDLATVDSNFLDVLTFTPHFEGSAEATLPVYFPTSSSYLGDILLGAGLSLDAGELDFTGNLDLTDQGLSNSELLGFSDGFFDALDFENFDIFSSLPLLVDGFDLFLGNLQSILQGQVLGVDIPFLGNALGDGATVIEDFRQDFVEPFRQQVEEAPQRGLEIVQDLLFRSLWSTTVLTKLNESAQDSDLFALYSDPTFDIFDFDEISLGDMRDFLSGSGDYTDSGLDSDIGHYVRAEPMGDGIQWNFVLGGQWSPDVPLDFDLGFPALGLELDADPQVILDWSLGLGFGLNTAKGAYFDVGRVEYEIGDDDDGDGFGDVIVGSDTIDEFQARAQLAFNGGDTLTGQLGFLKLEVESFGYEKDDGTDDVDRVLDDDGNPIAAGSAFVDGDGDGVDELYGTGAFADFEVDLVNTAGDDTLAFYELGQLDAKVTLEAGARLDVQGTLQFNDDLIPEGAIAPLLPSIQTDFVFDWGNTALGNDLELDPLIQASLASGLQFNFADALNEIAFDNVALNVGSFLTDLLGPIVGQIQEITGPLEPIIEVITAPIPVISDLAGKPVTLVDLAATFGEFNPGFIYAIADIIQLVNTIEGIGEGDAYITIGSFSVFEREGGSSVSGADLAKDSFDLSGAWGDDLSGISGFLEGFSNDFASLLSDGSAAEGTTKKLLTSGFGEGGGFDFPILTDPAQIFGLLVGRPAVLVTYDMPPFVMDFEYQQSFPVYGPIFAVITVGLGMQIDLAFGYDTQGFQTFADGDFENPLDLLGGFYVSDRENADGSGADVPELILSGEVFAGAEVNLGIGSAGVEGGVILTVNFDLYDPDRDGRVRLSELLNTMEFEALTGSPALAPIAIFDIYGDVAAQLRAYIKILTSKFTLDITPPIVLFEFEIPFDREPILANEDGGTLILNIGDYSHLRQEGDTRDIGETIRVEETGTSQVKVWSEQFGVPVGAAQTYTGVERILVRGGEGNDTIDLSRVTSIAAEIYGGEGNDAILLGGGDDLVYGGLGNDIIDATLASGGGDNIIFGGRGDDEIKAGGGDDLIFGGSVFLRGRDGDVATDDWTAWTSLRFTAGTNASADGNNRIHTGNGQNLVIAGAGDDVIVGGDEKDTIFADGGTFKISRNSPWGFGTEGDVAEYLDLGEGGNDRVFGGGGSDTIYGGPGDDVLKGGESSHAPSEDPDADVIYGNKGFDILFGDGSAFDIGDPITADPDFTFDGDTLEAIQWAFDDSYSHGGNELYGGTEDDLIFGGFGDSVIDGGKGGDTIFGDGGRVEYTAEGIAIRIYSLVDEAEIDPISGTNTLIGGGNGGNILFGGAGVDDILGGGGPDLVFGGNGADTTIDGTDGADVLFGDTGLVAYRDYAGAGVHRLIGDEELPAGIFGGDDFDDNPATVDLILTDPAKAAGSGVDTVIGGAGDDIVLGGGAGDFLYGDWEVDPNDLPTTAPQGGDIVVGDWGRLEFNSRRITSIESLFAGDGVGGNDTIYGNGGNDILIGGSNGDLVGEANVDVIHGVNGGTGSGEDYEPFDQVKVITGFDNNPESDTYGEPITEKATGDDIAIGDNALLTFLPAVKLSQEEGFAFVTFGGYLQRIDTTDTTDTTGGEDEIYGDLGSNILIGGAHDDEIYGAAGDDVILGDSAVLEFGVLKFNDEDELLLDSADEEDVANRIVYLEMVESLATEDGDEYVGGGDTIRGFGSNDIIIAGVYGDDVWSGEGDDTVLGDNGRVDLRFIRPQHGDPVEDGISEERLGSRYGFFFFGGAVEFIETTDEINATGGEDTLYGEHGDNVILGGAKGDEIHAGTGDDIVLGDSGKLEFGFVVDGEDSLTQRPFLSRIETTRFASSPEAPVGGADTIFGAEGGRNILIGGIEGDEIYGGDEREILVGDNALLLFEDLYGETIGGDAVLDETTDAVMAFDALLQLLETIDEIDDDGGVDFIFGGGDNDIILGGVLGDFLFGEAGSDIILGDQGRLVWGDLTELDFTDEEELEISNALIELIHGTLAPQLGEDDPIDLLSASPAKLNLITVIKPNLGGPDMIHGGGDGGDFNLIFGGTDSDLVIGGEGTDIAFGDHGRLYPHASSIQTQRSGALDHSHAHNYFSIFVEEEDDGAGDLILGNSGDDILIGQQGNDLIFGGKDNDVLIGGHNVPGGVDTLSDDDGFAFDLDPDAMGEDARVRPEEFNDILSGGSGNDVVLGDNASVWYTENTTSPRYRELAGDTLYDFPSDEEIPNEEPKTHNGYFAPNILDENAEDPLWAVLPFGRMITLLDHGHDTDPSHFGDDLIAGGSQSDMLFGGLGDDVIQGDGTIRSLGLVIKDFLSARGITLDDSIDVEDAVIARLDELNNLLPDLSNGDPEGHSFDVEAENGGAEFSLRFDIFEDEEDGDDYIEGNGGSDLIYGGLGQDDLIGGSSALFGLATADQRPDTGDELYGGAGERIDRNQFVFHDENFSTQDDLAWQDRHGRDADVILGDNANVYRLVGGDDQPLTFNFDTSRHLSAGEFFQARQFAPGTDAQLTEDTWYALENGGWILIQPRAFELLDYQAGVGDTYDRDDDGQADGINSGDDLIHGESGDDLIHGMAGHDAIFGNSEDDQITGGTGNDWISGGTGDDGVLGDDGLILPSRNGQIEPLYGLTEAVVQQVISTPGNIQLATINQSHELKMAVRLFAFPGEGGEEIAEQGNDIVFGGLGNDWLHGGAGGDAISGAEALPGYYDGRLNWLLIAQQENPDLEAPETAIQPWYKDRAPINPGDILLYEGRRPGTGEFALYDEHDPWRRTMLGSDGEWLKNAEWVDAIAAQLILSDDAALPGNTADYLELLIQREVEVDGETQTQYLVGLNEQDERVALFDFLLNFDPTEGVKDSRFDEGLLSTDGDDRIFGDLGNDWQVGGSGRDHMYGGRGDDMLNMDDDHGSNFGDVSGQNTHPKFDGSNPLANNLPDAYQSYSDIVYGGAGRDRLILNTGADRAIDWVGEFNSYVVPFSPFGAFHISRSLQPHLQEFLYALSESDGADQWAPDHERFDDHFAKDGRIDQLNERVERHYEPYGELGMVLQQDFDWNEQTGAPDDPQPGNFQGKREIMRRELFLDEDATLGTSAFSVEAGDWAMGGGLYTATSPVGEEAVSIQHMQDQLPGYLEILVDVRVDKDKGGVGSNGYIIFDYQDVDDFKFAGIDQSTNKLVIGQRTDYGWETLTQANLKLWHDRTYELGLVLNGNLATVVIDGQHETRYAFADALNDGYLALGVDNSVTHFSNYQVQKLPPLTTHESAWDFAGSEHGLQAVTGDWQLDSGLLSSAATGEPAMLFGALPQGVGAYAVLEMETQLRLGEGRSGLVYDYHDVDDYKFALLDAVTGQLVLGYVAGGDPVVSTILSVELVAGEAYDLKLTLTGGQVSAALKPADVDDTDAAWQLLGHVYYSQLNAGDWGLMVEAGGNAEFDHLQARTNDSAYLDDGDALTATRPAAGVIETGAEPTQDEFDTLVSEAWGRLQAAHGDDLPAAMPEIELEVVELGGLRLAQVVQGRILIDASAAGHGWFVDDTPADDVEFTEDADGVLCAAGGSNAAGRIDLLTVLMHELGHLAGMTHGDDGGDLMAELLEPGVRLLPERFEKGAGGEPEGPDSSPAEPSRDQGQGEGLAVGHDLLLFDLRSGALRGDNGMTETPPVEAPARIATERVTIAPSAQVGEALMAGDDSPGEEDDMTFDTVGSSALSRPLSLLGKFGSGLR